MKRLVGILRLLLLGMLSLGASYVGMVAIQTETLSFFYDVVPGEKSQDGPIIVFGAYLICWVATLATAGILAARQKKEEGYVGVSPFLAACFVGPVLMVVSAAISAWMAVVPE